MSALLVFVTLVIYGLAIVPFVRQRSLRYLLMLGAGHLTMLLTPLWQLLFNIEPVGGRALTLFGRFDVPWSLLIGGGALLVFPVLVFYYGLRNHWWPQHMAAIWGGFAVFVVYFLVIETILQRNDVLLFNDNLVIANTTIPAAIVQAVLLSGVSLGMLYIMVSQARYGLRDAIVPLLLSGIISALLFLGVFASPLWIFGSPLWRFDPAERSDVLTAIAGVVSLLLVLWGVHLIASGLHAGRRQQFVWR